MRQTWINRSESSSCILFFNGWGMDERVLTGLQHADYNVCMFNDYRTLKPLRADDFQFRDIFVVAWSLGVCAANIVLAKSSLNITLSIAINGTIYPWHDKLAIPESIFQLTLSGWNERNRLKFNQRMLGGKNKLDEAQIFLSERSIESQKQELQFFYELGRDFTVENLSWHKVIVAANDRIIPSVNQLHFWQDKANVVIKEWAHFPFAEFSTWDNLIKMNDDY